jgi:putative transposase
MKSERGVSWPDPLQHQRENYLWRTAEQDGVVLYILVQECHDAKSAQRFFKRLMKGLRYVPRAIVTDKLRSYGWARHNLLPDVERRQRSPQAT